MAYQYNRPAAYLPDPARGSFVVPMHTLSLPAHWEEALLRLYHGGMTEGQAGRRRRVPTAAVNQLMRATAPDIVTVDSTARFGSENPWLYCQDAYPMAVTNLYLVTWLKSLPRDAGDPETAALLMDCFRDLDSAALSWRTGGVDLLEQKVSPGGTALPAPHVYRLLPDVLAERIARQGPYEHHGQQLSFRQVAGRTGARGQGSGGAELMSNVIEYVPGRRGGGDGKPAYYAATLRITVRTVPFSPVPRVHVAAGVRRFVTGKVYMPYGKGVSAYLLPDYSLVHDGPQPQRFAVAMLEWRNGTTDWRQGGAEGMLAGISALDALPSPDRLVKEADHWIHGRDGIRIAIGHQAAMGRHMIGTGLMPSERRRLIEWAERAIAPEFISVPKLERSAYARPPKKQLKKLPSIPKNMEEKDPEERAVILDQRELNAAHNAQVLRTRLAEALEGEDLTAVVLHQNDAIRDQMIAAAETGLGLAGHRREQGPDTWVWEAEELTVRLHARPLGALGAPLGGDGVPRRGQEHDEAIEERRIGVARAMSALRGAVSGVRLAFVELDGQDAFRHAKRRTDPKHAIRLGCADAGLVTQFIRPPDPDAETDEALADAGLRAAAAWSDGLRQTGMRLVPQHTLGDTLIPANLNQVAFHLVERRLDGPTGKQQFTPIAVLIRPGAKCVLGKSADMHAWVPYPELLKSLTGRVEGRKNSAEQSALMAAFVKKTLAQLRSTPTLVLAHAQDVRKRWPWLRNDGLERDRLGLDGGPVQRIGLYGKQLRIVRIADGSRDETAQCWAEAEELSPELEGQRRGGIAMGLWRLGMRGDSDRVFYSTTGKSGSQPNLTNDDAKLTPHTNASGNNAYRPTANAWNPDLLELTVACLQPGDDAEAWAAFVHQQRFSEDYRAGREGLALPLILHLARLADDYALPHEIEEAVDPTEPQAAAAPDDALSGQLAFDFDLDDGDDDE
ncbi:pPIWI_RE module domain-containing protein [Streptomyces sp. NPDC102394]|uniref:pPIWI_RE module domain-containing protein n=1 Tax=Streptomyces sp. NPDC102394 TaxID=3366167 RepID=UPI003805322E